MAFRDIVGQKRAIKILQGIIKRQRIPSAMLFSGDSGVGKRLTALNLAKTVNCLNRVDYDCCDKCISCKKIDKDIHPDIYLFTLKDMQKKLSLEKQYSGNEYPIEAIRKIEELLYFRVSEGKKKIIIIDDADAMNIYAANAFLKTLEEPPEDSTIILISENPDSLLETVRSRCINIRFYPLSLSETKKIIEKKLRDFDLELLTGLSMGRPGLALSSELNQKRERFEKLLFSMMSKQKKEIWADREEMESWLEMVLIFLRDRLIYLITKEKDLLFLKNMMNLIKEESISNIINAYQSLEGIRQALDSNLNKLITWNYVESIMKTCLGFNGEIKWERL